MQVDTFVTIPDNPYTRAEILCIKEVILGALNWKVTVSTHFHFLSLFIKASADDIDDTETNFLVENLVYFLSELAMINFSTLKYSPSMISAATVYAAEALS
ncbi:G2/mitotic-specific cyclin S13-7 [Trifolium repens]|jgi:hypothetical protein|nr:G2/mitotic-specific cyclin S13-7 [Trifolium repens]